MKTTTLTRKGIAYEMTVYTPLVLREAGDSMKAETPEGAANYWRANVATAPGWDPMKEHLVVLFVTTRRNIIGHNVVSMGTLDGVSAHPREVFRPAIVAAASAIIVMHNHPSGDPTPSEADVRTTRKLIQAGKVLEMEILDHVIMGEIAGGRVRDWSSLRELGYFYS